MPTVAGRADVGFLKAFSENLADFSKPTAANRFANRSIRIVDWYLGLPAAVFRSSALFCKTFTFMPTSRSLNCAHACIQPLHHGAECIILSQVAAECLRVRRRRLPVVPICLRIICRLPLQALAVQRYAAVLKPEMTQGMAVATCTGRLHAAPVLRC